MWSAAGTVEGWNVMSPKWADLAPGLRYCICLANGTDADITAADLTIEGADPDPEDECKPGEFATLEVEPDCGQPLILGTMEAKVTVDEQHPIRAHSQCQVSFPCPKRFVRVTGTNGGLDVTLVIRDLKRSGMAAVDGTTQWPFGLSPPPEGQVPRHAQPPAAPQRTRRGATP